MKISNLLPLLLLLLKIVVSACHENIPEPTEGTEVPTAGEPIKTGHGALIGAPVIKSIGPNGGELQMPDASIRLSVPAGAVNAPTTFSIQQVENTFPGSTARSYRLLPEGVKFSKPVTLTLSYQGAALQSGNPEFLYLTYQDAEGFYRVATNTFLHKENQTLTVETTHFSDWTYFETIMLVADDSFLNKGESTKLKVMEYMNYSLTGDGDPKLGVLEDYVGSRTRFEWSINYGGGTVTSDKPGAATFKAPATVPTVNPVGVGVRLSNFTVIVNKNDPTRNYAGKEVLLLQKEIQIGDEQFLEYTLKGTKLYNTGDYETGSIRVDTRGKFSISSYINGNQTFDLMIKGPEGKAIGVGTYSFGNIEKGQFAAITVNTGHAKGNEKYSSSYQICTDRGCGLNTQYTGGTVTITKWAPIGGYIEGEISANLFITGEFDPPATEFKAKFRVKRVN
ncbi:hypothetical protein [Telluribacter sp.]|jgi:hypothetical protein|uniref:hypothetical protein n=1 Tax=Telluribacter sp. TaxID=1978767 RepID=UPI002E15E340|nr:hypothetical protein [Telluribacter sp.]